MIPMLPAAVVAVLSTVGVRTTSGPLAPLAQALTPVARPLLIVATLVLVWGLRRCGAAPAAVAALGGALLYVTGMQGGAVPSRTGTTASMTGTSAAAFYLGLSLYVMAFVWPWIRRRRGSCRPMSLLPRRLASS
jgi:hypothetical protein